LIPLYVYCLVLLFFLYQLPILFLQAMFLLNIVSTVHPSVSLPILYSDFLTKNGKCERIFTLPCLFNIFLFQFHVFIMCFCVINIALSIMQKILIVCILGMEGRLQSTF